LHRAEQRDKESKKQVKENEGKKEEREREEEVEGLTFIHPFYLGCMYVSVSSQAV
jgi:hypothetical protein